jgi:hypothetical protein
MAVIKSTTGQVTSNNHVAVNGRTATETDLVFWEASKICDRGEEAVVGGVFETAKKSEAVWSVGLDSDDVCQCSLR